MVFQHTYAAFGLGLSLFLFQTVPALGQAVQSSGGKEEKKINITADHLSVKDGGVKVEATGNVEVIRGETTLKADEVQVNRRTQDVEATGKVSVDDPQGTLKAERARLNLERETGEITNGDIFFIQRHLKVRGERFKKLSGQSYHIDEGFFTTCLCESGAPHWKIGADEVDLQEDGTGIIKRGTFYIMDVPVFYLPYAWFPLRTERKTGFLIPKIGFSSIDDFRIQQPFFWAISKNTDATFSADVETRSRVGVLGQVRTVLNQHAQAELNLSYFSEAWRNNANDDIGDRTITDQDIPQNRWSVIATHRHMSSSGWETYSDIFAVSDDLFTRELVDRFDLNTTREADIRRSRFDRSRLGIFKSWGDMHFQGETKFFQDFIQPDRGTLHQTPRLSFWGWKALAESPIELRWRAEGVNYVRKTGADGLRFDLRPELVVPFRLIPYLLGSFDLALRETAYHLYNTSGGSFDQNNSRELVEIKTKLGTSIGHVFNWGGSGLKKIKHAIEPELSYFFIPGARQRDIPVFDGIDRINRRNLLTFSLTNRLWGKFAPGPGPKPTDQTVELLTSSPLGDVRELGRLRVAMSYDIDKERNGGDSLSDLDMDLKLTPTHYVSLGFKGGLNPGPWQFSQAAVRLSLTDPRPITRRVLDPDFMSPNQLGFSFRFIRRSFLSPLAENANLTTLPDEKQISRNVLGQVAVNALVHVTDYLLGLYNATYDTRDSRFTSNRIGVKLLSQCECWTVTFSVNKTTNPSKTSFGFNFNLLGLGSQNSAPRSATKGLGFSQ